ncbi:MAG: hypothetical protein HEQ10_23055 [Dolichospermum sp. DEX182a]|nr:hypothetical protein [Dolichospermum sp. DEX182a]
MKLRNLGLALTAVCATAAGVVGTANNAYADTATADIHFSGSTPGTCAFSNVSPGLVVMNGTNITSDGSGDPGAATVTCTGPGTITLSDPVQTSGPSLTFTTTSAYLNTAGTWVLQSPGTGGYSYPTSRSISSTIENYIFQINMTTAALIPPGNYDFKTTLTATY